MDFKYVKRSVAGPTLVNDEDFEYNLEGCECQEGCSAASGCKCLQYGQVGFLNERFGVFK